MTKGFLLLALLLTGCASPARALVSIPSPAEGILVSVDKTNGDYKVTSTRIGWTFAGTIGSPLSDVAVARGQDTRGSYQQVSFQWSADRPLRGAIRAYQTRPVVQFSITSPQASQTSLPDFPAFSSSPKTLHSLSYKEQTMSGPTFSLAQNGTPWILFDDAAHTAVLSAASDFLVAQMHGQGDLLASGLDPKVKDLPAGFTHRSLLTLGTGIQATMHTWGEALTAESGKPRPADDADLLIKSLGYWTDNGAYYYYNYDKSKGYAGTLLALVQHYREADIPIRYLQLDSWWYQKTRTSPSGKAEGPKNANLPEGTWNAYGGTLDYSASPDLFPQGLAAFQKKINLPIVVHARWIDPASAYHQHYKISGLAPVDPRWWDDRMQYLQNSGVVTYEQDWLSEIYPHSPDMASVLGVGAAFTDNMARAAKQRGQTLQYCMPLPRFFLQGSRYDNLTTIRTSFDRFDHGKWNDFLYTSLLADAMHIRPFTDVFMSTEVGNLTIATLSSGPVGIGDALGRESRDNLLRSVRGDGMIVKPDAPLLPTDASIEADAQGQHTPLISATYTDNGLHTAYVFACNRSKAESNAAIFIPQTLGLSGQVYVYSASEGSGKRQDAAAPYTGTTLPDGSLYEVAPIGRSGMAFLGDQGKIVGTGRQRIPAIQDRPEQLTATVAFAPGEKLVTLHGYAPRKPSASVIGDTALPVSYDSASGEFTVSVSPSAAAKRTRIEGDPATLATVIFRTGQ